MSGHVPSLGFPVGLKRYQRGLIAYESACEYEDKTADEKAPSGEHSTGGIFVITRALGHSRVVITEKYYAKWNRAQQDILDGDLKTAW